MTLFSSHRAFDQEFITPFGPLIGKTMMSDDLVEYMKINMKKTPAMFSTNLGDNLDRVFKEQPAFDVNTSNKVVHDLSKFIKEYHQRSALASLVGICQVEGEQKIELVAGWFDSRVAGEDHPIHSHPNCLFSCVGYLEIPKQVAKPKDNWDNGGCIEFSYGTPTLLSNTNSLFRPQVGDFYIFPGWLNHTVYPFEGEGCRWSFSMNLIMKEYKL
jgi:hypothetical protein|tara:strand:- start:671 stop:1312 length:642 start_codon:yes stop_codon:yes gene_type:complete